MGAFLDLTGKQFGEWTAIRYLGKSTWECINNDGEIKNIHSYTLRTKLSDYTKINLKMPEGILGKTFGDWKALKYLGEGFWECQCKCGNIGKVNTYDLKNELSTKCRECASKEKRKGDLKPGDKINEWTLIEYAGNLRWHCKCSCGEERDVLARHLVDRTSKSCGHDRNYHIIRDDITGREFGSLIVLGYTGKDNMWKCRCNACNNVKNIHRDSLMTGKTKSCGCLKEKMRTQTLLDKYGDNNTTRINNPREDWQIEVISNAKLLQEFIDKQNCKPTATGLAELLNVNDTTILKALKKFGMEDIIEHNSGTSDLELSLASWIESLGIKIETGNRSILNGKELDIYIPEKKMAIEFNGTYWHSSIYRKYNYHQIKTIECSKKGIHLIHIFEYEWLNIELREKLKGYLKLLLIGPNNIEYARNTTVKYLEVKEAKEFLDKYHFQGYSQSSIRLGCYDHNNSLIGVMTFGKPRFNNKYDWELIRLCWKPDYKVIGGAEKLFKHFIMDNKPTSIVCYTDISKFTGNIYTKLGFKVFKDSITSPNYVWVNMHNSKVLTRYQTMKHKLLEAGLGNFGDTEDNIMESLGYIKIYDSGNLRLEWIKH